MKGIPKLSISGQLHESKQYSLDKTYPFRYRSKYHRELPHVVKFSGGRSSGMLLFTLLENGFLQRNRGDVVVFNNTSCEHPETYKFVAECKKRVEAAGIPFFFVQFQTYEDARQGEWQRIPSYRLVNESPFSETNPDGFQWRGEVFEELLSSKSYLPNQFSRVCTQSLKLDVTRQFLQDWFASKERIPHLGHGLAESLIDLNQLYRRHVRNGGGVPKDVLLSKKEFVLSRPTGRPQQAYQDFSSPARVFENTLLEDKVFGQKAWFGNDGVEYVVFIGLRGDEHLRVARVEARRSNPHANIGYEGEHVYVPMAKMHISKADVNAFWEQQNWDLKLPQNGILSNCVYCFLKGPNNLIRIHETMEEQKKEYIQHFGSIVGTPCDIDWWVEKEKLYRRDLIKEERERSNPDASSIGFFGASSEFSYGIISSNTNIVEDLEVNTVLPCDCTE